MKLNLLLFIISFISLSIFANQKILFKLPTQAKISIKESNSQLSEKDAASCRDFKLTESQVRKLFSRYHLITDKELHDQYLWGPCTINGSVKLKNQVYTWTARIGNTLQTDFPDGKMKTLGGEPTDSPSEK